jgi:hypothetical protein
MNKELPKTRTIRVKQSIYDDLLKVYGDSIVTSIPSGYRLAVVSDETDSVD